MNNSPSPDWALGLSREFSEAVSGSTTGRATDRGSGDLRKKPLAPTIGSAHLRVMSVTRLVGCRPSVQRRPADDPARSKETILEQAFRRPAVRERQQGIAHLCASGPRAVLEAVLEIADGKPIDDVLRRYTKVAIATYRMIGADVRCQFTPNLKLRGVQ